MVASLRITRPAGPWEQQSTALPAEAPPCEKLRGAVPHLARGMRPEAFRKRPLLHGILLVKAECGSPAALRVRFSRSAQAARPGKRRRPLSCGRTENGRSRPVSRVLSPRAIAGAGEADIPLGPALPR